MKKYLIVALIIILGLSLWAYRAFASSVGPNNCGTAADDAALGTITWTNPTNGCGENGSVAEVYLSLAGTSPIENSVKIVQGGSIAGTDKSTGATIPSPLTYVSYGGSSDLWGLSWTTAQVNNSNFGVAFSGKDSDGSNISHYLKATGFGFSIPSGSTINGILVEIKEHGYSSFGDKYIDIDNFRITIYYTTSSGTVQSQVRSGNIKIKSGNVIYK